MMKINYDTKADALYIKLVEGKEIEESDEISNGIILDYDKEKKPVGIEFLDASKIFGGKHEMHVELGLTESIRQ